MASKGGKITFRKRRGLRSSFGRVHRPLGRGKTIRNNLVSSDGGFAINKSGKICDRIARRYGAGEFLEIQGSFELGFTIAANLTHSDTRNSLFQLSQLLTAGQLTAVTSFWQRYRVKGIQLTFVEITNEPPAGTKGHVSLCAAPARWVQNPPYVSPTSMPGANTKVIDNNSASFAMQIYVPWPVNSTDLSARGTAAAGTMNQWISTESVGPMTEHHGMNTQMIRSLATDESISANFNVIYKLGVLCSGRKLGV